jgi:hypothetical protein
MKCPLFGKAKNSSEPGFWTFSATAAKRTYAAFFKLSVASGWPLAE